ncbi:MAG TPA: YicC family protein [Planctomycetaceae bacterium]|nr:YicC family protein [Planctomycetaceae bacterium]
MLLSMTGFGTAALTGNGEGCDCSIFVEIKTVNNRYLKISTRLPEGFVSLESRIEAAIREKIVRGTVNATIRMRQEAGAMRYRLNPAVLNAYVEQLKRIDPERNPSLDRLLRLPGVVEETYGEENARAEQVWPTIERALSLALEELRKMRLAEGVSMGNDLLGNLDGLVGHLEEIERLAPKVVELYRVRLADRIGKVMQEMDLQLQHADLVREVALFTDRADISEETVRLHSHFNQFRELVADKSGRDPREGVGRKLDFLTQEFFREVNTIGSKAGDAGITKHVVEMKNIIERIREMVQNVE